MTGRKFESANPLRRPHGAQARQKRLLQLKRIRNKSIAYQPLNRGANQDPQTSGQGQTQILQAQRQHPTNTGSENSQQAPSLASGLNASGEYEEFPLRCCSAEELKDSRYHILKFHSKAEVDPASQFTPPIRFHRKDPKSLQIVLGDETPSEGANEERRPFRKRKTHQAQGDDESNEAARKLRYEEHFPWIMEDFDSKNTWVSNYEAGQSSAYVVFVLDSSGFKMIPIEKWYRMTALNKFSTLSLAEAEKRMSTKRGVPRWIMEKLQQERGVLPGAAGVPGAVSVPLSAAQAAATRRRMRMVVGAEDRRRAGIDDEMDYDEKFDDDEEAPILDGPEEELKEVETRIKREQRQANIMDEDVDTLFEDEDHVHTQDKKLRKSLRSLENNAFYDSDNDENPYLSEEESDSDLEVDRATNVQPAQVDIPVIPVFRKKVFKNLPPGMVVLQLPPQVLSRFSKGEWNPNVKRAAAPPVVATATTEQEIKMEDPGNSDLLTPEDVLSHIPPTGVSIRNLLAALRSKLKLRSENQTLLRQYLKEHSKLQDGLLVPLGK